MAEVQVIGLDIAKSVLQLHGLDADGEIVLQKRLTRARLLPFFEKLPLCLIGIEACGSSLFWARELSRFGHKVRLMPAQCVKPYVKRQKNDMADAEAIAEAVTRPNMRFVPAQAPDEQSAMMLHKVRMMLNRQLVVLTNAIRAHMAEFGLVAPVGRGGVRLVLTSEVLDVRPLSSTEPAPTESLGCSSYAQIPKLALPHSKKKLPSARPCSPIGRRLGRFSRLVWE